MSELLQINDWLRKQAIFKDCQFETLDGRELVGSTTKVRRTKDGVVFAMDDPINIRGGRGEAWQGLFIWYFHPDMKSVELLNCQKYKAAGITQEINNIEHAYIED